MMRNHIVFNIPTPASVTNRMSLVSQYAAQFLRHNALHESAREFAERVAGDWKDRSMRLDIMREIRRQQRIKATV